MAILTGALSYLGSFKNIRHYRNLYDRKIYAGEKGGANRNLIMKNSAFKRTRENMSEFGGCGVAVKAIRHGWQNLLPENADAHFTGRLMKITKKINLLDIVGKRGMRAIIFSACQNMLQKIVFNTRVNFTEMIQCRFSCSHSLSRDRALVWVSDLTIRQNYVPQGATHFRLQNHISVVSDFVYSMKNRRYEPSCLLGGMSAFGYSAYTPVLSALNAGVEVVLPVSAGVSLPDDCTIVQCVGVEFYIKTAGDVYLPVRGGCMKVAAVF